MNRFQKLALATFVAVVFLVFVGAVVRASGSGLGCPDWPTCWGCLVPPWNVEQIDFERIDLEKFRLKAQRYGRDPASVTPEALRAEFNPLHTWVEYLNRLTAMPVLLLTMATFVASFWQRGRRPGVWRAALASLLLVLGNALLGAWVVFSGLHPGIITLHMALAMLQVGLLVYIAWRGTARPWVRTLTGPAGRGAWLAAAVLLALVLAEGVMGSQVRELTDQFAKSYGSEARSEWTGMLEHSGAYLVHRSFSWLIVLGAGVFLWQARRALAGGLGRLELGIGALVGALMAMGLVLSQVGVLRVVQVLHVGVAVLLAAALVFWLLATRPVRP